MNKWVAGAVVLVALGGATWLGINRFDNGGYGPNFVSGNGRIEAIEVDIASKMPGRIGNVLVAEGDYVQAGQPLVSMDVMTLRAQRDEAQARLQQARQAVASANAQVAVRQSDLAAAQAMEVMRRNDQDSAARRLERTRILSKEGAASVQELEDDQARVNSAQASVNAASAQVNAARAAVDAAQAEVAAAESMVQAAQASVARVDAELADSEIDAPRSGRIQFIIARESEVVGAGAPILNLVDLDDAHMTFFLPEMETGQVRVGAPARIVLDAFPDRPLPAKVTYVSSTAQFTPKTVETADERQKMMFRIKANVDPDYIDAHRQVLKTGLPGVTWVSLDGSDTWPESLQARP